METNSNERPFQYIEPFANPAKLSNFYDAEYFVEINREEHSDTLRNKDAYDNINEDCEDEEGFFVQKKYCMETWYEFDDAILYAAKDFHDDYSLFPNMVVMNDFTYDQICWLTSISPKRKFITDDDNEEKIEISIFEYSDCTLNVATTPDTEDLKNMEFYIVYDEDYGDDDDDNDTDDEPDLPIDEPDEQLKIIKVCEYYGH